MILDKDFITLGMHNDTLNKAQFELLGESYPPHDGWEERILELDISQSNANLFLFLRGKLSIQAQKQIIQNYQLVSDFHKQKKDPSTISTESTDKPKSQNSNQILTIYCDGACQGNPGKAGSGIAIYKDSTKPRLLYGDYIANGTNNIAELNALHKALLISKDNPKSIIYSDSKYSIDCITKWAYSWKKNNWQKKGGEIKNLELIKEIHSLYETLKNSITIKHIKGHSGVEGNELADRMAIYAIYSKSSEYVEYKYKNIGDVISL